MTICSVYKLLSQWLVAHNSPPAGECMLVTRLYFGLVYSDKLCTDKLSCIVTGQNDAARTTFFCIIFTKKKKR